MAATVDTPHFDEIVRHPDDAVTGYSYFAPSEAAMKKLVDELFVHNWPAHCSRTVYRGRRFRDRLQNCTRDPHFRWILDRRSGSVAFSSLHRGT